MSSQRTVIATLVSPCLDIIIIYILFIHLLEFIYLLFIYSFIYLFMHNSWITFELEEFENTNVKRV